MTGVVVGIDGSAVARNAARWAARETARRGSRLRIVYADPTTQPLLPELPGLHWPPQAADHVRAQVAVALEDAVDAVRTQAPDVPVRTEAVSGSAPKVLIAQSESADLVVVGDRGFGGFTGLLAGAVAMKTAAHARCSVAVVPDTGDPLTFPVTGPVVAGVDDAASAEPVLAEAFAIASTLDVALHAVHTWQFVGADLGWLRARPPEEEISAAEERFLAELLGGWSERFPDVAVTRFVRRGDAAAELLAHAREAQLVVAGAHGRGRAAGAHLGSTGHKLIHHAPCPVLIARG